MYDPALQEGQSSQVTVSCKLLPVVQGLSNLCFPGRHVAHGEQILSRGLLAEPLAHPPPLMYLPASQEEQGLQSGTGEVDEPLQGACMYIPAGQKFSQGTQFTVS